MRKRVALLDGGVGRRHWEVGGGSLVAGWLEGCLGVWRVGREGAGRHGVY